LFCIVAFALDDDGAKSMVADGILGFCDVCGMRDGMSNGSGCISGRSVAECLTGSHKWLVQVVSPSRETAMGLARFMTA
jgi:hypothetical protein